MKTAEGLRVLSTVLKSAQDELETRVAERTEELRAREEQLRLVTDNVPALITYIDAERRYGYVNRPYSERYSKSPEELIGRPVEEILGAESYGKLEARIDDALAGRRSSFTVTLDLPDGSEQALAATYVPDCGDHGEVRGFYGLIQDLTELKAIQAQLFQAGKLGALGELGAGIAHELNQPLAAIQMFAEMMRSEPQREIGDYAQELEMIVEQTRRMSKIVDNIRAFARKSDLELEVLAALDPLDQALMLLAQRLRLSGIEVVRDAPPDLPAIRADGIRLQQVFLNLLSNSLQALEELPAEAPKRILLRLRPSAGLVEYTVEDTGPGIPPAIVPKIFDPFFTTKEVGRGTGLGLSLAYGTVEEHGGEIRYREAPGGGARFVVSIPRAADGEVPVSRTVAALAAEEPPASAGRILIVDDERVLRFAFTRILEHAGWEVAAAGSAPEALAKLSRARFDLVLADLRMPGTSGLELAASIGQRWPETGVIVVSGYVTDEDRERLEELGVAAVLPKTAAPKALLEAVGRAFAEQARGVAGGLVAEPAAALDGERVEELRRFDMVREYAEIFLDEVSPRLESLRRALAGNDRRESARIVHSINGPAGWIGARKLQELSNELERLVRDDAPGQCASVFADFEAELRRVEAELRSCAEAPVTPGEQETE